MLLGKQKENLKKAILIPAYKRYEYTESCLKAMAEAQEYPNTIFYLANDGGQTIDISKFNIPNKKVIINHDKNLGLRTTIIEFFDWVRKAGDIDIIAKIDNDCIVPKNWLDDIIDIFYKTDVDILSPNVFPSNAAYQYGIKVKGLPHIPATTVGGLWCMKKKLIDDIEFVKHPTDKLLGAIALLRQIVHEKEPKIGWADNVMVHDVGHWSGNHPDCIKTPEHEAYYHEVGRKIAWGN